MEIKIWSIPMTAEEGKLFFAATKKHPRNNLLFLFSYLYGLRVSEAIKINISDILPSPEAPKEIYIRRLKGGIARHYPIRSEDNILLKRYLRKRADMKNADGNPWLFITSHSSQYHMSAENGLKLMKRYSKKIALSWKKPTLTSGAIAALSTCF